MNKIIHSIVFLALVAALISCGGNAVKKTDDAVPVTTANVTLTNVSFYNSFPGNTVALKEVKLLGQVTGYVTGIYFKEGKTVYAGEKLYEIDRRKYQAAYDAAKSNVTIAQDNYEKAQRDATRYTDLNKEDAVAKQLYDDAQTDLKTAKQKLDVANAELITATTDYENSLITAPFKGTIGFSSVKIGSLVTTGVTLLNTVSSDDTLGVDFEISETELARFEKMEDAAISNDDSTYRITLPDNSTYPYNGRFSVIDRAVDPQTGSIKVRITIPNNDRTLKPGMSCKVLVLNNSSNQQVLIPFKAVLEQLGEYFVYVVKDKIVKQVKITLGPRVGLNVIILKGLGGGETIVVDGIQKLHDGTTITIAPPQKK